MQTIESLLQSTLSENSEIRQNAELEIKKLSFEPEFALNLSIVSCLKISISIRQLSLVLLKSYIDSHWSLSCPGLVKSDIKSNILRGLDDPSSLLRVLFANVVSKIAHLDDLWLDLLPTIVSLLKGSNDQIHSSLLILIDFVEGDLAESHLPIIAPVLFPELSRIFNTPSIDPDQRARALQVLTEFIKTLFNLKDQHKNVTSQFVEPVFNQWIPLIIQELNSATTCLSVKIQCLESSTIFYQCFRKSIPKSVVPLYFESSVKNLIALEDNYQVILDSQESDTQLESFILSLFEFCFLVIYDSSLKPLLQDLSIFYKLILSYSRITQSQVSNWTLNLSDFVAEEEEVSFSFNLRRINEKLIDFIDEFPTCLKSLVSTFLLNLQDGLDNWKSVESCLFLIGNLSDSVIVANESKSIIDLGMFFQQVVLPCLSKHGISF